MRSEPIRTHTGEELSYVRSEVLGRTYQIYQHEELVFPFLSLYHANVYLVEEGVLNTLILVEYVTQYLAHFFPLLGFNQLSIEVIPYHLIAYLVIEQITKLD